MLTSRIRTTPERLFDLSLDMGDHALSLVHTGETAVTSTGGPVLGLGDEVTFRARHFGVPFRMTARVVALERPGRIVDEQVRGPFCSLRHEHMFVAEGEETVLTDRLTIRAPLGSLGSVVARYVLVPHLRRVLEVRAAHLRAVLEDVGRPV